MSPSSPTGPSSPTRRALLLGAAAAGAATLVGARTADAATASASVGTARAGVGSAAVPAQARRAASGTFVVPADSVPHTRTWMAWPDSSTIWGRQLSGVQQNIALIAKTIAGYEPVYMLANSASVSKARSMCGSGVTVIGSIPVNDCWMRDTGPVFRTNGAGGLDTVGLNFNGWGNRQTHTNDAQVAKRVAAYLGLPFTAAGLVCEGGAIETDGAGTLMATRSSIINTNRNPNLSQAQIEAAMCAAYGASEVIWFTGIKNQDITDDHVDATSRFLGPGAAAVQIPDPNEKDVWATDEKQQYQALSAATDAQGARIGVTRIQGPNYNVIRSTSQDFVGSYANYYVCNNAVISAQFGDSNADGLAYDTLSALFPGRTIEQLNIDNLGNGGGGIHCVTQQQPAV